MNPLVSAAWLAARFQESDTVVLDASLPPVGITPAPDTRARYREQHIPGAVFFDIDKLSDPSSPYPHMLPSSESFAQSMSELGVSDTDTIVLYEQEGVFSAPRGWWMLRTFGAKNVYVLDGGLKAWITAGFSTESGMAKRASSKFHATLDQEAVKSFDQLQELLSNKAQVLDARSQGRFKGTAPEPRAGLRSGHMPGATNIPYTELIEDGKFKNIDQLRDIFISKGVRLEEPVTTSCGSGITAAVLALGLEVLGAPKVSIYDGSWAEYGQRTEAVVVKD